MLEEEEDSLESETELTDEQKIEIAKWFLLNSPAGEIQYVAKGHFLLFLLFCLWFFSFEGFFVIEIVTALVFVCDRRFIVFFEFYSVWFTDVKAILKDENVYRKAAEEAFPSYNKSHLICLELPNRSGDVSVSLLLSFGLQFVRSLRM